MSPLFLFQLDLDEEYDIVQKIGEGWFSRVYLTEHRQTRQELVLKVGQVTNQSRVICNCTEETHF